MKVCNTCHESYSDDMNYCVSCGGGLSSISRKIPKQRIIIAVVITFVAIVSIVSIVEAKKFSDSRKAVETDRSTRIYEDYISTPTTSDVEIEDGWTWDIDGDYINIEGSVCNISNKSINYYEVTAEFLDSNGNVIDTDWTNGSDVSPNNSSKFDMMYKYDRRIKNVRLEITNVS